MSHKINPIFSSSPEILLQWEKSVIPKRLPDETDRDYYVRLDLISRSDLELLNKGPEFYLAAKSNKFEPKESSSLILGTAVHCALLEPSEFSDRYAIADIDEKPTGVTLEYTENIIAYINNNLDTIAQSSSGQPFFYYSDNENWVKLLADTYETYKLSTDKKRIESFDVYVVKASSAKDYILNKQFNQHKTILTTSQYNKIQAIKESVDSHKLARKYIYPETYFESKNIQSLTEQLYVWAPEGATRLAKSLLDRVIFDYENETVYLIDLKTSSSELNSGMDVIDAIVKWNYPMQIAFYYDALSYYLSAENLSHFEIRPYIVMVETSFPFRSKVCYLDPNQLSRYRWQYERLYRGLERHLDQNIWKDFAALDGNDEVYFNSNYDPKFK